MAIIHSNGVPQKNPAKAAGLSLPNVESGLLQGALPIRLEVIGPTWRCIKQTRDVRVYCGERPQLLTTSGLRSRPNIAACIRGWAAHRGVAAAHRGRVGAHAAGPAAFAHAHGLITARCAQGAAFARHARRADCVARRTSSRISPRAATREPSQRYPTRSPYVIAPGDVHAPQ
jgi:hypothetical protein